MTDNELKQSVLDGEHLRLLVIGYKVSAGVSAFMSLIGLLYVFMGLMFGLMGSANIKDGPPAAMGWMFGLIGFGIFAGFIIFGLLQWRVATCLEQHRSKTYCTVIAAINCMHLPWGTILSIFTFMVLSRETVARMFEGPDTKPLATGPQTAV